MKGIGRGTIQRCDARPLTAPFLLMFHNYYHAINSNGTGGRPLRKRHSSARVINIRFWFAENSLCRSQPSPFLSPFFLPSFFFFTRTQRIEKGFLDLSPTVHFFPLPRFGHTFPSSRAITFQSRPDSRFRSLRRKLYSLAIQQPPFFSSMDLNFSAVPEFLFSILARSLGRGKGKVKRGNDSLDSKILPIFFLRISFPREDFTGKSSWRFYFLDSFFLSFFSQRKSFATFHCEFRKRINTRTRMREREWSDSYAHCGSLFLSMVVLEVDEGREISRRRCRFVANRWIVHRLSCLYSTDRLIRKRYPREIDFYANEFALTIREEKRRELIVSALFLAPNCVFASCTTVHFYSFVY